MTHALSWVNCTRHQTKHSESIIDIGGGESTLVDDLLARGYQNISVLDISQTAVDVNQRRLGSASEHIRWIVADITQAKLESCAYDVGHDRAVFHFLTAPEGRVAYVRQVANAVKPRRTCDRQHFRARRPHEMQWSGRCSL